MEYHEAANFLFDLQRYATGVGVESTKRLLSSLDDPQDSFRVVQIAGSNGKGSTARMVERVLREAGFSIGLYTSPHLDDLRERVRIDGRMVSRRAVCEFVETVEPCTTEMAADGEAPTFFETVTTMALWAFDRADVDVAVLEVGIGGRYDATSAVDPDASAVTSVTLEHADMLGDTIEEIARDKATVAPDDAPLVTAAEGSALEAIASVTDDLLRVGTDEEADVVVTDRGRDGVDQQLTVSTDTWEIDARIPLLGSHQVRNAGVALALTRQLDSVDDDAIVRGLRNSTVPGRFEVMQHEPRIVLDGAHNPGGCATIAETLSTFEYDALHVVFGAMSDKDHVEMVAALPSADHVYTCRPDFDRAETPEVLAEVFERDPGLKTDGEVEAHETVDEAVDAAIATAGANDVIVIAGSLFVVAEARRRWTRLQTPRRVPDLDAAAAALEAAQVPEQAVRQLQDTGVHRVISTRLRSRQAKTVERALESAGGTCAISGIDAPARELLDVLLMGTLDAFESMLETLEEDTSDLQPFTDGLRRRLGFDEEAEARSEYPWTDGTAVMGVLNVTPDSFHDGGRYEAIEEAIDRAEEMIAAGADVIDVGGESTRPGAEPVPVDAERRRVLPIIERLADSDTMVSIDTRKPAVAEAALDAGADILNDVSGLEDPAMRRLAAERDIPVVVMHSIETPVDPDTSVEYDDVVTDTIADLNDRVILAERSGLDREQILVDPGLGFGKKATESFELLGRLSEFRALGCPILVGHSHKSMFGAIGRGPDERLSPTIAASALAADRGADVIRVHDVDETVAAVDTAAAANDPDRFDVA
ncbi:MAG: dihydropteroate synthase [Natronomonas sp.]